MDKILKEILSENGVKLKIDTSGFFIGTYSRGYVYEGRIVFSKTNGDYAVVLTEEGSIDTNHRLYLVSIKERYSQLIDSERIQTPSCIFPEIENVDIGIQANLIIITYQIGDSKKKKKYSFDVKEEISVSKMFKEV